MSTPFLTPINNESRLQFGNISNPFHKWKLSLQLQLGGIQYLIFFHKTSYDTKALRKLKNFRFLTACVCHNYFLVDFYFFKLHLSTLKHGLFKKVYTLFSAIYAREFWGICNRPKKYRIYTQHTEIIINLKEHFQMSWRKKANF